MKNIERGKFRETGNCLKIKKIMPIVKKDRLIALISLNKSLTLTNDRLIKYIFPKIK